MTLKIDITGIGGLPHHQIDPALTHSMRHDIPFLPQLPKKSPREFMVAQAFEHLPGVEVFEGAEVLVDLDHWDQHKNVHQDKLDQAFHQRDFSSYRPSPESYSCWNGLLYEASERSTPTIKMQMLGPFTAQLLLKGKHGKPLHDHTELAKQCTQTLLAQALAMIQQGTQRGHKVMMFLDEPALYFLGEGPRFQILFEELKLYFQSLKKLAPEASIGLHCCSNTKWEKIFSLPLNYLSFDIFLSWRSIYQGKENLRTFLEGGGHLALGILPTYERHEQDGTKDFIRQTIEEARGEITHGTSPHLLLTPTCGQTYVDLGEVERSFYELQYWKNQLTS